MASQTTIKATAVWQDVTTSYNELVPVLLEDAEQTVTRSTDKLVENINKAFPTEAKLVGDDMKVRQIPKDLDDVNEKDGLLLLVSPGQNKDHHKIKDYLKSANDKQAPGRSSSAPDPERFITVEKFDSVIEKFEHAIREGHKQSEQAMHEQQERATQAMLEQQKRATQREEDLLERHKRTMEFLEADKKDVEAKLKASEDQLKCELSEMRSDRITSKLREEETQRMFERVMGELETVKRELEEGKERRELLHKEVDLNLHLIGQLAARIMPINLRILLDESRQKVADLLGEELQNLTLRNLLSEPPRQHSLSQETLVFLWVSNKVQLAGNIQAHNPTQVEIHDAVDHSMDLFGQEEYQHLKELYEFCFDCSF